MRKALIAVVVSIGLAAAAAPQAGAVTTPTRAEYVAQVDPICQSFVLPMQSAFNSYQRNVKRINRALKKHSLKAFLNSLRRTAGSLNVIAQNHANMLAQISAVPPPLEPAIGTWLTYIRQEHDFEAAAANALLQFKFKRFSSLARQADAAAAGAVQAISGFGFTVCGVTVT